MKMNKYLLYFVIVFNFIELEFKCLNNEHECVGNIDYKCIPNSWVCDYNQDCIDNSDEVDCPRVECNEKQFKCHLSSSCISKSQVCDGRKDCLDNEDEKNCTTSKCDPKIQYDCENTVQSECIPLVDVCQTKINCTTKKDLAENCSENMCKKLTPCSHICINKYSSYICDCPDGMTLADDKKTCESVNKCYEDPSVCYQDCKHMDKNYECSCYIGYRKNGNICQPKNAGSELYLLFSSRNRIYSLPLFDIEKKFSNIVINSSYNILSFDAKFNGNDMVIYSSVVEKEHLMEISNIHQWKFYNSRVKKIDKRTFQMNLENITLFHTALDPARNLLFFTDYNNHSIFVMNLTNSDKVRIIEDCHNPYDIVIDPVKGRIYWIDLGSSKNNSSIIMANMDGSNKTILQYGLKKPTSLAIDIDEQRLYWADHLPSTIKYINLDQTSHIIQSYLVLSAEYFLPVSLYVFGNRVYWSNWQDNLIYSAHKIKGNDIRVLTKSNKPSNLKILSMEINHQLINTIDEQMIAKYCSGSVNTCPSSCLPNFNFPEEPKCFGFSKMKSNNNSLWLILVPVFLFGCLIIVLFKYRFTKTKVVRQPETGNVYIYDNVKFYEDQNSTCHENNDYSDVTPIIAKTE